MGLNQIATIADYVRLLRQTPPEVHALADDLLIHVTGFFRDPEVWEALRKKVVDPMVAERSEGGSIRAWVSACSTGEEAFSLAIILVEACRAADSTSTLRFLPRTLLSARLIMLARVFSRGGLKAKFRRNV